MKPIEFIKRIATKKTFSKGLGHYPKGHLLTIGALAGVLAAGFVSTHTPAPGQEQRLSQAVQLNLQATTITTKQTGTTQTQREVFTHNLGLPAEQKAQKANAATTEAKEIWHTEMVKSGDNLSVIFNRAGLSDATLYQFLQSGKAAKQLTKIHPGQKVEFKLSNSGDLEALRYQKNRLHQIIFNRTQEGFKNNSVIAAPDIKLAYREAIIINSLFLAGTDAGMEQSLIMELASIFGWDIDFALDIRTNDSFRILYEEKFLNGEKLGNGAILAAEFTNQNQTYRAVRYTNAEGDTSYFTPEGNSMRKAFLRTPVDFARISSHFNLKRRHPILNRIRAHKGTDYAAPTGTPIKAAGNGKVIFAGTKGGYGRTVIIRHGQSYKTLYAHMHKYGKGIRSGKKVKQGQIIGYVGKSGLATGPHLHYEFYKNGAVRNPVTVKLPKAKSIPKSLLSNFKEQTQPLVAKLDQFNSKTQLALSQKSTTTN